MRETEKLLAEYEFPGPIAIKFKVTFEICEIPLFIIIVRKRCFSHNRLNENDSQFYISHNTKVALLSTCYLTLRTYSKKYRFKIPQSTPPPNLKRFFEN